MNASAKSKRGSRRLVKVWHLLIYSSLLVIILLTGWLEYNSRYQDILGLYQDYAHATATAIAYSGTPPFIDESEFRHSYEILLSEMLAIEGVEYIGLYLPDFPPILVSNRVPYSDLRDSRRQLLQENFSQVNIAGEIFIEVNEFIAHNGIPADLQVGFSTAQISELRRSVINQILVRSGFFTIALVAIFIFLINRQNTLLLRAEKSKIEQDVIRLEQINRQQEKQAAVGTLAAGLAHEIRNPLNAIGILAQRLKRQSGSSHQDDEIAEMSATMVAEIKRLNQILEDFLSYSRPTPLKFSQFDLQEIFSRLELLFDEQARKKRVELVFPDKGDFTIKGDPEYLKQALANIVRNGLEATPTGGRVTITADTIKTELHLTITDTGHGIPDEEIARIFDLFYTTREEGNGIGLAVTHKIISDHNGTIEVTSEPGKGTSFHIILPMELE